MDKTVRTFVLSLLVATMGTLYGCSGGASTAIPPPPSPQPPAQAYLYAYVPGAPAIVRYPLHDGAAASPQSFLGGKRTGLTTGHGGIATDATGRTYVLEGLTDARFLVFGSDAKGNIRPIHSATLGNLSVSGFALDGDGNFWTADTIDGTLLRYALSSSGTAQPNMTITPQLSTPLGMMRAYPTTVALDDNGDVYCICVVLYRGASAQGVTQYHLAGAAPQIVRSFYDFRLPELPTSMLHIGKSGELYLASSLFETGVFVYAPSTPSGEVHGKRWIGGPATEIPNVASIDTDDRGRLYVATAKGVAIFAPGARGDVAPVAMLPEPTSAASWTLDDYGDFFMP